MAEAKSEQEPSIEEILESIRQIISDDTEGAKPAAKEAPQTLQAPQEAAIPTSDLVLKGEQIPQDSGGTDDILDLVDVVPHEPMVDLSQTQAREQEQTAASTPAPEPIPEPEPVKEEEPAPMIAETIDDTGNILSDTTAEAATAAMSKLLAGNIAVERMEPGRVGHVTLEDIAKEMMRPLIKTWLDQNLPKIIEKLVAKEIEKLSRRAMDQ